MRIIIQINCSGGRVLDIWLLTVIFTVNSGHLLFLARLTRYTVRRI